MQLLRILLIEDNLEHQDIILTALKGTNFHYTLKITDTLTEGLCWLNTAPFDIVLLDLSLPDSKPHNTIKQATKLIATKPVIILTALNDQELKDHALDLGAIAYLEKTFDYKFSFQLQQAITQAIQQYQYCFNNALNVLSKISQSLGAYLHEQQID